MNTKHHGSNIVQCGMTTIVWIVETISLSADDGLWIIQTIQGKMAMLNASIGLHWMRLIPPQRGLCAKHLWDTPSRNVCMQCLHICPSVSPPSAPLPFQPRSKHVRGIP